MSKNTLSNKFRKVDVDQFDEDRFVDEGEEDQGDQGPSESEVNALLQKDKFADALTLLLSNAPLNKSEEVKRRCLMLVLRVLVAFKVNEMDACLKSMEPKNLDILMKYIYRGFEEPSENSSAALLTWHQKAFAVGGLGSIMRVMTDRKRV